MLLIIAVLLPGLLVGQGLDPKGISKPLASSWPTYNGDYSGRRFSKLSQINGANVKNLIRFPNHTD
jgi:hypothetical protein